MCVCGRKRISATEAIDHPFLELANHRGLGNRIMLDRHRAYLFRRKWEVRESRYDTIRHDTEITLEN